MSTSYWTTEQQDIYAKRVIESAKSGFKTPGADSFKGKTIIILAMGPSRGLCKYDAEVWAVNQGYKQVAQVKGRVDKLFLAHTQVHTSQGNPYFDWDELNYLTTKGLEVLNTHTVKGLMSKKYPIEQIAKRFGINYFSDTICYMIAYALYLYTNKNKKLKEPLKICVYGVDMQDKDEYVYEKPGVEFWLGYAMGLGVEVENSFGSTLLTTFTGLPYGEELPISKIDPLGLYKKTAHKIYKERKKRGWNSEKQIPEIKNSSSPGGIIL